MMASKAQVFEALRPRLFGLAYRMLGIVAEAEDVVQEAFVRWDQAVEAPRSDEAWLIAVTARIAIDRSRRAATERAAYQGRWLPEPVPLPPPDQETQLADDLSLAFLIMLERLAPEERAALLLREVFESEYAEIARTLGKSEAACRQLVHRARQRVRRRRPHTVIARGARERIAQRFIDALRAQDRESLMSILADDALLVADGGGRRPALADEQRGAARVAQLLIGFDRATQTYAEREGVSEVKHTVAWLNGEPAVVTLLDGKVLFATVLHLDGARISGIYRVLNPDKLLSLGWPILSRIAEAPK